jgi:hypothetical protein
MKIGKPKQGVRWHSSYDVNQVRFLVEKKVKETLGMASVDWIDVVTTGRNVGSKMETNTLTL